VTAVADGQAEVAALLGDPATHAGAPVERVDTHGAVVFLAGERAYKMKRAVSYPYMDFSTLALRERAARAEVVLNRRTAPDLYLGVVAVRRLADRRLVLGGEEGEAVEWVVAMRRFDQGGLFDRLAEAGRLDAPLIERLAEEVAAFHAAAEPHRRPAAAAMAWVVEDNIAELAAAPDIFDPATVGALAALARRALERHRPLMDARAAAGRVRRCHGDLHLRNVTLIDGRPTLFDAIDFNDDLAVIDVLYDLAFLLMDLEHRRLPGLANRVMNRWLDLGEEEEGLALLPLFLSTRAAVRAKVSASTVAAVAEEGQRRGLRSAARAYLAMAVDLLRPPPPLLLAIGGLSGTGKSTLAHAVAPPIGPAPGAVVLRTDVVRKRLLGHPLGERLPPAAYDAATTARVYGEIARRAGIALAAGHAVVADGVHARPAEREALAGLAARAGAAFRGVWLEAPAGVTLARVAARRGDASDADRAVLERQLALETGRMDWPRIDAGRNGAAVAAEVLAMLPPAVLRGVDAAQGPGAGVGVK
jgi:aminoglycoside phosphotransferase family enzyme/predicted kinase